MWQSCTCQLTVNTEDSQGNTIKGYWTVLSQNGATVATGFSPSSFSLNSGQQYSVAAADYGSYVFDHWKDNGSTIRDRPVSTAADSSITAIYKNLNNPSAAGPCSLSASTDFTIVASPSSLTVQTGTSGTSTVTVSSLNGFNSAVSLTSSSIP